MSLPRYYPQLDGLRALAVLGVLCNHFSLETPYGLPWGQLGVRFFFILSGFFATLSLWRAKERLTLVPGSVWKASWDYYSKRLVRIGPAYYLTVLCGAFFLGIPEIRNHLLWHLTFTTNFFIVKLGHWPLAVSHFWSLSVQEQFYLLWPWLVLLLPRQWFLVVCLILIPMAQMFCVWMIQLGAPPVTRWVMLPGCLDSFAYGALAAHMVQMDGANRVFSGKRGMGVFLIAAIFLVFGVMLRREPDTSAALGFVEMFEGVFLVWMLAAVYFLRPASIFARVLGFPPLVAMGRFSYGLFLYHVFVIIIYDQLTAVGWPEMPSLLRVVVLTIISALVAYLSYRFFEQPIVRWWKRRHQESPAL